MASLNGGQSTLRCASLRPCVHSTAKRAGCAALDHAAPAHEAKDSLGHTSLATTCRYIHARPGFSSTTYLSV